MLKLTMSATLLNAVASSMATVALNVREVLQSTDTLLNTARNENLPVSFVKAIRAFYGQEPLVDAAQPE